MSVTFGWLLTRPEMAQYFGTGMAFDLRGLLVERFGLNIRNDLFHGLLDIAHMSSEGALYVWWLILRICCTNFQRPNPGKFPNPNQTIMSESATLNCQSPKI